MMKLILNDWTRACDQVDASVGIWAEVVLSNCASPLEVIVFSDISADGLFMRSIPSYPFFEMMLALIVSEPEYHK